MFQLGWSENFDIFLDNLSIYHVCLDLFSLFMIIFTWWYCSSTNLGTQNKEKTVGGNSNRIYDENEDVHYLKSEDTCRENDVFNLYDDNIVSNVKFLRQKALVKELKSKLTEDELEEERKTEKMQLEKIFQLLQEEEDKFQMSSMEQLEDQLHMYVN